MILNVDEQNRTTVLYPSDSEASAAIEAGKHVPVPVRGTADAGSGCEWIVAVFSDTPLDQLDVLHAVESATHLGTAAHCAFEVAVDSARTVQILAMTR